MKPLRWIAKKLKYYVVLASLFNMRTGWIDQAANIQVLVLFNYVVNTACIRLLFLSLRETHYGLYLFLTVGLSALLLIPYCIAMYGIFHRRILHSAEAVRYAKRFASRSVVNKKQQLCGFLVLGWQPILLLAILLALSVVLDP